MPTGPPRRPGDGKSLSLTGIAAYAAEQGYSGLLFSVEMDRVEITSRIVSAATLSAYSEVTWRELADGTRSRIEQYLDEHQGMRLAVYDKEPITVVEIAEHARRMKRTVGLDLVCVDYVQLVSATDTKVNRERQIAETSVGLRNMAKALDIVVISAAQLNRSSVKDNRPPTKANLRDSGSLENDADVIVPLNVCEQRAVSVRHADDLTGATKWLRRHVYSLATTEGADGAYSGIWEAIQDCRREIDLPAEDEICVTQAQLDHANNSVLTAYQIATVATKLGPRGQGLNRDQVRYLDKVGAIRVVGSDGETKFYRLGDVLVAHVTRLKGTAA
ncbi:DnaB-like helicase C-terminal domain-containing protein [Nocardia vermiculata]|uniref:SF4 helicase domain-containing protein n=1 Tax=Nocardia vermiculata TaxID=257274 RepID=A0A846XVE9_9NOCA|nr:DnaB-like helicase C-terminal domain-containing protein [Nocardia vermiculata]NKY49595.1 hypothetical protein [Nocardia vermiculata]